MGLHGRQLGRHPIPAEVGVIGTAGRLFRRDADRTVLQAAMAARFPRGGSRICRWRSEALRAIRRRSAQMGRRPRINPDFLTSARPSRLTDMLARAHSGRIWTTVERDRAALRPAREREDIPDAAPYETQAGDGDRRASRRGAEQLRRYEFPVTCVTGEFLKRAVALAAGNGSARRH